jgi:hypothetical protein
MKPKQILVSLSESQLQELRKKYFETYPEDKAHFHTGIISSKIAKRVDKFITRYGAEMLK